MQESFSNKDTDPELTFLQAPPSRTFHLNQARYMVSLSSPRLGQPLRGHGGLDIEECLGQDHDSRVWPMRALITVLTTLGLIQGVSDSLTKDANELIRVVLGEGLDGERGNNASQARDSMLYRRAIFLYAVSHVWINDKLDEILQGIRCNDEKNVCQSPTYAAYYAELPFKHSIQGP